ncbi:MAG TPA: hypothetical protein VNV25_15585 [Gemmatimonadaceae bacterium]|jgi:hypothetical protein|nr:hypothetical protein [Gemmatimonadaceae bacterium]
MNLVVKPRAVISVISAAERKGDWELPAHLWVYVFFGRVRLDLRHARFLPGTSEIEVIAMMGEVKITLPHGVRVESEEFKIRRVTRAVPRDDAPCIRIVGHEIMGQVKIKVVDPNDPS